MDRRRRPLARAAREAAVRQQLVDGMPVVQTSMRVPGGDAVQRVYGAPAGDVGEVAVVEIANESPAPFVAALVVRGASAVDLGGATVCADGRSAMRTPRPPSRWAAGVDGSTEETVASGAASDGPFAHRQDRGARLVGAFLYPVAHRTTLRAVVSIGTQGIGAAEPGALPDAAAVARGWPVQLDRGMRVELPDEPLQRAVDTARAATVLAGQAWRVEPEVAAVLEDWGSTRRRRWRGAGSPVARVDASPAGSPAARRGRGPGACGTTRRAAARGPARRARAGAATTSVSMLADWPPEWIGQPIDVRDARPDAVRCRARCGGTATDRRCCGRVRPTPPSRRPGSTHVVVERSAR